jgi:hypothetical protein
MKSVLFLAAFFLVTGALADGIRHENYDSDEHDEHVNHVWRDFAFTELSDNGTVLITGGRMRHREDGDDNWKRDSAVFGVTLDHETAFGFAYFDNADDHESHGENHDNKRDITDPFGFSNARLTGAVRLLYIVEYLETNGVDGYQPDADTQLSNFSLTTNTSDGSDLYYPISITNTTFTDGMGNTYVVHELDIMSLNGVFHARIYASSKPIRVDNRTVTPDRIKLTYAIDYWNPNNTAASNNTDAKLALIIAFFTSSSNHRHNHTGEEEDDDHDGIDADGDDIVSAGYSWESDCDCRNRNSTNSTMGDDDDDDRRCHIYTHMISIGGGPFGRFGVMLQSALGGTWSAGMLIHNLNVSYGDNLMWDPDMGLNVDYSAAYYNGAAHLAVGFMTFSLLGLLIVLFLF